MTAIKSGNSLELRAIKDPIIEECINIDAHHNGQEEACAKCKFEADAVRINDCLRNKYVL